MENGDDEHADRSAATAGSRRRPRKEKRACDKCSASRTRCIGDGEPPCRRCAEYRFVCEYQRVPKKRGNASRNTRPEGQAQAQVEAQVQAPTSTGIRSVLPPLNLILSPSSLPSHCLWGSSYDDPHSPLQQQQQQQQQQFNQPSVPKQNPLPTPAPECRYPVLRPLLPHIVSIMSPSDACNLLDLYFTEASSSVFEPASPYIIAPIFRKKSFLCGTRPRPTSPSLLATMIWVVSQTASVDFLRSGPRARARVCNELFAVCEALLALEEKGNSPRDSDNKFGTTASREEQAGSFECPIVPRQHPVTSDSVLAYALIGTVISGSETRKECLRWWTKAWNGAKELGLNREQSDDEAKERVRQIWGLRTDGDEHGSHAESMWIAEWREERRRIWWLLYMADRHLALCYNAPLSIMDAECHVYQPWDNLTWQTLDTQPACDLPDRYLGPCTIMLGSDVFEYFLPLMAVLGDVVEIHHWGRHPRFASIQREAAILQTERALDLYEQALRNYEECVRIRFESAEAPAALSPNNLNSFGKQRPLSPEHARLRTIIGYSQYLIHVLHILLHGSWDPIEMIDGPDWTTPQSFIKCATHTISAAGTVAEILELDPELNFMPYLFGIYLLHGSFILLIFADRMDMATSETIIQACETTSRAHEVCVVTLNTEYQRTFRKVLRSALCNVRGTILLEAEQHKARRREFLMTYRWDRGSRGLAI